MTKSNPNMRVNSQAIGYKNVIHSARKSKREPQIQHEGRPNNYSSAPNTNQKPHITKDLAIVMEENSRLSIDLDDSTPEKKLKYQLPPKEDISDLDIPNKKLTKSDLIFLEEIQNYSLNHAGNKSSFVMFDDSEENGVSKEDKFDPYSNVKSKNLKEKAQSHAKVSGKENVLLKQLPLSTIKKKQTYFVEDDKVKVKYNTGSTKNSSFHNQYFSNPSEVNQPQETPRLGRAESQNNSLHIPQPVTDDEILIHSKGPKKNILQKFEKLKPRQHVKVVKSSPMKTLKEVTNPKEEESDTFQWDEES